MRREHVAVIVLLLVLLLVVTALALGTTRSDSYRTPEERERAAGRHVRADELAIGAGRCRRSGDPLVFSKANPVDSSCTMTIRPTDAPFWDLPIIDRWLPRELRRIDLQQTDATCLPHTVLVESERTEFEIELTADDPESSIAVEPSGATLILTLPGTCAVSSAIAAGT